MSDRARDAIHDAIDHQMKHGDSDVSTSFVDGVLAPINEYHAVSPDISKHVPFAALFYRGKPELVKKIIATWQMAAYRHWGFWYIHEPENTTLKLYTFRNEGVPITPKTMMQEALWYVQDDYSPKSDGASRFWTALAVANQFMLLLCDKNQPTPGMLSISLRRVHNDEFVAVDVADLPHDLVATLIDQEENYRSAN